MEYLWLVVLDGKQNVEHTTRGETEQEAFKKVSQKFPHWRSIVLRDIAYTDTSPCRKFYLLF